MSLVYPTPKALCNAMSSRRGPLGFLTTFDTAAAKSTLGLTVPMSSDTELGFTTTYNIPSYTSELGSVQGVSDPATCLRRQKPRTTFAYNARPPTIFNSSLAHSAIEGTSW